MAVTLRTFADSDLDALFTWESDPRAVQMAAFTRANASDRRAFDAHYERVRSDPSNTLLAIDDDGEFVGTIGSFTMEGEREVTSETALVPGVGAEVVERHFRLDR
jgi:RimJ/RimL family protein N-acetyltransferase